MLTIAGLGLRAILIHWRMTLMMALTVALSLAGFLVLRAYHSGLNARYANLSAAYLTVEQSGSMGEIMGSRLEASLASQLSAAGASQVIPEIHTVVGSTPENAVLLRGVSLEQYAETEAFRLIAGRPLLPDNPPRQAMIGHLLAAEKQVGPGGTIQIRGRDFQVAGVFSMDTYADHEAWISLQDAQALLGWGSDVSVFLIPAGEQLNAGDELPGGVSIVRKGQNGVNLVKEWEPLFDLLGLIATSLGVASAVALANILWRLAWLRRRELAILQSLGFGRRALTGYLFSQAAGISLAGYAIGVAAALALGQLTSIQTAGISIRADFDAKVLIASLLFAILITLAGTVFPAVWLSRMNLAALLRADN
jgi:ABC-type lipoprotein release transport system permease subunit